MLTQQDLQQIAAKGIAEEQLQKQMDDFKRGFPFLRLDSAATVGHGILAPTIIPKSIILVKYEYIIPLHKVDD